MPALLLTAPTAEPVTVAELKAQLRIENADEDALLARLISSSRQHIEALTRRVFMPQTWRAVIDAWPVRRRVVLPITPVRSIISIRVFNAAGEATTLSSSTYKLDRTRTPPHLLMQAAMLAPTATENGIEIDLEAGYTNASDVPKALCEAILRLSAFWYEQRLDERESTFTTMPPSVENLISPYRVVWP